MKKTRFCAILGAVAVCALALSVAFGSAFAKDEQSIDVKNISIAATEGTMGASGSAIVIGFGLTSTGSEVTLIDKETGWYDALGNYPLTIYNELKTHIVMSRDGKEISYFRYIVGGGKIGIDVQVQMDEADKHIKAGDELTLKTGLTAYDVSGVNATTNYAHSVDNYTALGKLAEDVTYYFNGSSWVIKKDISTENVSITATEGAMGLSGSAIVLGFGLTSTSGEVTLIDKESGWYASGNYPLTVYNQIKSHLSITRNGKAIDYYRYLVGGGKIGIDVQVQLDDADKHIMAGDILTMKAGLKAYDVTGVFAGSGYAHDVSNYSVVGVLQKNAVYVFDGTSWLKSAEATDATFTNSEDDLNSLAVGSTIQLTYSLNNGASEGVPVYGSSNEEIATVNANGVVTGVAEGDVVITAQFLSFSKTVTLKVNKAKTITSISVNITTGATKNGEKYLVGYVGENLSVATILNCITACFTYSDGTTGSEFVITEEMISTEGYVNTAAGVSKIAITNEGVTAEIPVYVYAVTEVDNLAPERILGYGSALNLYFYDVVSDKTQNSVSDTMDFRSHPEYGVSSTMAEIRLPAVLNKATPYEFYSIGFASELQCLLYFGQFNGTNPNTSDVPAVAGTVLTLKDSFRFYRFIDETWLAVYKFSGEVSYVWDGSRWKNYVADATDFTLDSTEINVPVNSSFEVKVALVPATAYAPITYFSDNQDVIEVVNGKLQAKSVGSANVKVSLGSIEKNVAVTVIAGTEESLALIENRVFYVAKGGKLDLSKIKVNVSYGMGYTSSAITLNEESVTYNLDTSVTGRKEVELNCTVSDNGREVTGTVTVTVEVVNLVEVYPDNLTCADDNAWSGSMILIYFQKTFPNTANVYPSDLSEAEAATMLNFVTFERNGAEVVASGLRFLTYIMAFTPTIDGVEVSQYVAGDTIVLKKGLTFYKWYGEIDENNSPTGEGDYVKVGVVAYDIRIVYGANGKFAWQINPADGVVLSETVEVGLNEQHAANVAVIPEYATNGEWFYTVADENVATVNANGLISGKNIGQTKVTAVLKDLDGNVIKEVEYTVKVTDAVAGLTVTSEKPVKVKVGEELDIAALIEKYGISCKVLLASGNAGETVDLTTARVTGFDSSAVGEITLTFRLTVDGKSVTGTLKVAVETATDASGCLGSVDVCASALLICGIIACAIIINKRKMHA